MMRKSWLLWPTGLDTLAYVSTMFKTLKYTFWNHLFFFCKNVPYGSRTFMSGFGPASTSETHFSLHLATWCFGVHAMESDRSSLWALRGWDTPYEYCPSRCFHIACRSVSRFGKAIKIPRLPSPNLAPTCSQFYLYPQQKHPTWLTISSFAMVPATAVPTYGYEMEQ